MLKKLMVGVVLIAAAGLMTTTFGQSKVQLQKIKLPAGFQIAVWADGVNNARSIAQSPSGTIFVGTWNAGNVYALRDDNKDGKADRVITVASGLRNMPNGVAFRDGALYVAEINRILRFDNIEQKLDAAGTPAVVRRAAHSGSRARDARRRPAVALRGRLVRRHRRHERAASR